MIRTLSLGALVLIFGFAVIGCGDSKPPPKPDAPQGGTKVDPGKAPKNKAMEASLQESK